MIQRLRIDNFQSHETSILEFHKGVNVIIGSSDSGKSAIIRALKWALFNKPKGDSFRNWNGKDTRVSITTPESRVIRYRTNSENTYILEKENMMEFNAFGNDIPKEILEELNITELNFQNQSDAPFLLSKTSGEVASHFNRMAGIEKIDQSRQYVQKKLNEVTSQIKNKQQQKDELLEKLSDFNFLPEMETEIILLEEKQEKLENLIARIEQLKYLTSNLTSVELRILNTSPILDAEVSCNTIQDFLFEEKELEKERDGLEVTVGKIKDVTRKIEYLSKALPAETIIDKIIDARLKANEVKAEKARLVHLLEQIELVNEYVLKNTNLLKKYEKEYHENIGEVCPLCNSKIK